jgi:murein tripeptide amidase MpaA
MPYLNVNQVEAAVAALTGPPNSAITQDLTLPNTTWGGRTCHAVKLANGSGPNRVGVCFIGGVHAREWGSCDILVAFVDRMARAYRTGVGLALGGKNFTAAEVASIVDTLDVFVFPQVNADGRNYSMTIDTCWRKNRRPIAGANDGCNGVDINRNYDFLWNYPTYYSALAPVRSSTTTCGTCPLPGYNTYIGPAAGSEPETRNVVWLVDSHPNVQFFVDVHSYSQLILFGWGDDQDQAANPTMNFRNPAHNGQRGVQGDAYREWIDACDRDVVVELANRMQAAILAAHGNAYTVQQSFGLYPTSGTSTDYMWSRHFTDRAKPKVRSYTIEWGTQFQPPYNPDMVRIIDEVVAALVDLCLGVIATHADAHIRDNPADTGTQPSAGVFWESLDIFVRRTDDDIFAHQAPVKGQANYLYVRVANRGPVTARGLRVTARAVPFAGTEFIYPADWTTVDATHLAPTPIVDSFTMVAAGDSRVAKFSFSPAEIDVLWDWQQAAYHPCLLAEVEGCNDYLSPAGPHVWENNNLGQRNVTVALVAAGALVDFRFLVGNVRNLARTLELVVDRSEFLRGVELLLDPFVDHPRVPAGHQSRPVELSRVVFPERTRLQLSVGRLAGLLEVAPGSSFSVLGVKEAMVLSCDGAIAVERDGRQVLIVQEEEALVRLVRDPGQLSEAALTFRLPGDATPGEVYRIRVAQLDEMREHVGGVTFEVVVSDKPGVAVA